jgi:hypothetical protein
VLLRNIPAVDKILKNEEIRLLSSRYSYLLIRELVREVLDNYRKK